MNSENGCFALKEFDFETTKYPPPPPPESVGWEQCWHGYYQMIKTTCTESRNRFKEMFDLPYYENFVLEIFSLMSILKTLSNPLLTFFELGSGRAPMSLGAAAAVNLFRLNPILTSYRILAVEAEPDHFLWSQKHLHKQSINAEVVHGAVTSKNGKCRFMISPDPAAHMGQAVSKKGDIKVPSFTIDRLRKLYGFDRINIIHMDIQGSEVDAIRGAKMSLKKKLIDYLIIGTHGLDIEKKLKTQLSPTHNLLVELPVHGVYKAPSISKEFRSIDDGVHVYQRKGL